MDMGWVGLDWSGWVDVFPVFGCFGLGQVCQKYGTVFMYRSAIITNLGFRQLWENILHINSVKCVHF